MEKTEEIHLQDDGEPKTNELLLKLSSMREKWAIQYSGLHFDPAGRRAGGRVDQPQVPRACRKEHRPPDKHRQLLLRATLFPER